MGDMNWTMLIFTMVMLAMIAGGPLMADSATPPAKPVMKSRPPGCRTPWICGPAGKDCGKWDTGPTPPCRVPAVKLKFVALQLDASGKTKEDRLKAAVSLLERAADAEGPGVYLLPEYTLIPMTGPDAPMKNQEPVPGPSTAVFAKIADQRNLWVGVGMAEQSRDPKKPYNSIVFVGPHGQMHRYSKTHLFEPGTETAFREVAMFTPGETLEVFDIEGWCMGAMICADGNHPEVPRVLALKGAQVILFANGRLLVGPEAEAAATSNATVVVVCNYVGHSGLEQAQGGSRIHVPPWGRAIAAIEGQKEGWVAKEFTYDEVERMRNLDVLGRAPFIDPRSRRPELYGPITEKDFYVVNRPLR